MDPQGQGEAAQEAAEPILERFVEAIETALR